MTVTLDEVGNRIMPRNVDYSGIDNRIVCVIDEHGPIMMGEIFQRIGQRIRSEMRDLGVHICRIGKLPIIPYNMLDLRLQKLKGEHRIVFYREAKGSGWIVSNG